MTKKLSLTFTLFFVFVFMPFAVNAECTYSEQNRLNGLANNVTTDFDVKKGTKKIEGYFDNEEYVSMDVETYTFVANIYGLSSDLYLKVKNSLDSSVKVYKYADSKDGVVSFEGLDSYKITKYTVEVYAAQGDCSETLLRSLSLTLPKVNYYRTFDICNEAKDYYLCQDYITAEPNITDEQFVTRVREYIAKMDKENNPDGENDDKDNFFKKVIDFVVDYWYFFAGGAVLIGIGATTVIVIRVRRRVI